MKKFLILFAIIAVGMTALAQTPMVLTVIPRSGQDTVPRIKGLDKDHRISYFVKGKVKSDSVYIAVIRPEPYDINNFKLYYGIYGDPLSEVKNVSFVRDYVTTVKGDTFGQIVFGPMVSTVDWITPDKQTIVLKIIPH